MGKHCKLKEPKIELRRHVSLGFSRAANDVLGTFRLFYRRLHASIGLLHVQSLARSWRGAGQGRHGLRRRKKTEETPGVS